MDASLANLFSALTDDDPLSEGDNPADNPDEDTMSRRDGDGQADSASSSTLASTRQLYTIQQDGREVIVIDDDDDDDDKSKGDWPLSNRDEAYQGQTVNGDHDMEAYVSKIMGSALVVEPHVAGHRVNERTQSVDVELATETGGVQPRLYSKEEIAHLWRALSDKYISMARAIESATHLE